MTVIQASDENRVDDNLAVISIQVDAEATGVMRLSKEHMQSEKSWNTEVLQYLKVGWNSMN